MWRQSRLIRAQHDIMTLSAERFAAVRSKRVVASRKHRTLSARFILELKVE